MKDSAEIALESYDLGLLDTDNRLPKSSKNDVQMGHCYSQF
jgi:hypothetical protein